MGRYPGLDGLRGMAVALVVAYHAWPDLLPGGAFGVTIFFVLSGYLITRGLVREPIDPPRFYARRAARLLPCLAIVAAASVAFGGSAGDTWPALTYLANWQLISGDQLGLMTHTWSLAVEEHFYLAWPLILLLLTPRQRFRATSLMLGVAVLWRMALIASDASYLRVTVGTDTSAVALLAGCLMAIGHAEGRRLPRIRAMWPALTGLLALSTFVPGGTSAFMWSGFAVVALVLVLIEAATSPVPVLETVWLKWLGTVSYGVYLWHHLFLNVGLPTWLGVGLSILMAAISWRAVEKPILTWARVRFATRPPSVGDRRTRRQSPPITGNPVALSRTQRA